MAELDDMVGDYDAIVSMACGVGIQFLAERFPEKPVFPGVDTTGLAVNQAVGWYEERCRSCGKCVLGLTGGICPVTMCAKGLYNGPCGGTNKGSCEISQDQPCAWYMIYERLCLQGRLDYILEYHDPVNDWKDQTPRTLIQPGYKKPEKGRKPIDFVWLEMRRIRSTSRSGNDCFREGERYEHRAGNGYKVRKQFGKSLEGRSFRFHR
ncbi:MAG: methylenetetrahydrofolate reductase C-terminal domain-containing protein [Deltaproteobacteria bacterium]|nr:methylenetetrahydrofolate reductase C-terminal domain-containing protein [Deltaproteobacteria bacterium]